MSVRPLLINLGNNHEIEVSKDKFSVGRSLQADYVLNSMSVSRIHFFIEKKEGLWTIKDNSTNGTLVNESLLKSTSKNLQTGDVIKIRGGSVSMRFSNNPVRFVTTSSAPITDFEVSSINGDNLPSVSNDHCYERRAGVEEGKTSIDAPAPTNTSTSPNAKRERTPEPEESSKKNKSSDETTSNRDSFREELECSVCQELFIKAVTLNCSHTFCNSCILKWKSQRNYCPICREPIRNISPSIVLDNIIEKLVLGMDEKNRAQRIKTVTERLEEKILPFAKDQSTYESSESDYDDIDEEDDDEYMEEWSQHRYVLLGEDFFHYY